jgi:hypothetical protein
MNTCGECIWFNNGHCNASGFIGCSIDDLLKIKQTDESCDSFSEIE